MPFKSIFRALGRRWDDFVGNTAADAMERLADDMRRDNERSIAQLKSRSDWFANDPLHSADPWPVADDPYAKAEPCPVVQDPALERLRAGADPWDTPFLQSIERQNAAERDMIDMGFTWNPIIKEWELTEAFNPMRTDAVNHLQNLGMTWDQGRGWHLPPPNLG